MSSPLRTIIERILILENPTKTTVDRIKIEVARTFGLDSIPKNSEVIAELKEDEAERLLPVLRRKISRTISGVSVVAVMTKPYPCPHGRCSYCPGGPEEDSPQSYTGYEPAAMRGAQNNYDPYLQVRARINQLKAIGHLVDKVDLIIMGGTFPASPRPYQESFVKGCLDALTETPSRDLLDAKQQSEGRGIRNVGITVETRPDCVKPPEIDAMLELGVTRVELGVQTVYDDVYKQVERGHTIQDVVQATKRLKDSALKVCYHMMPGLPGSSIKRDLQTFKSLFGDPRFRPDMLKIYPTLVIKGTKLYDQWKSGDYKPLTSEEAAALIASVKSITPSWVRIMRVQRDIPLPRITAGVDHSNLRQLAKKKLYELGERCRCIRCREVGQVMDPVDPDKVKIIHTKYLASDGIEEFISAEDLEKDVLIGLLRLRIPSEPHRIEIDSNTALVRELHVYGKMVPVGHRIKDSWQHRGWGEALMAESEKIAYEDYNMKKLVVMSALGTKRYFEGLGYKKDGIYMSKTLS